jgi:hypothetical protein
MASETIGRPRCPRAARRTSVLGLDLPSDHRPTAHMSQRRRPRNGHGHPRIHRPGRGTICRRIVSHANSPSSPLPQARLPRFRSRWPMHGLRRWPPAGFQVIGSRPRLRSSMVELRSSIQAPTPALRRLRSRGQDDAGRPAAPYHPDSRGWRNLSRRRWFVAGVLLLPSAR